MGAPPIADAVRAVRARWSEHPPADGFALLDVRADDGLEVVFAWRRDPERYALRFPYPERLVEELGPHFTADDAAGALAETLQEELLTGLLLRARRRRTGDAVLLEPRVVPRAPWDIGRVPLVGPARPPAAGGTVFWVSYDAPSTPIADPGRFLDHAGFDGSAGRAAARAGRLIAWLQVSDAAGRAGHAVVERDVDDSASISVLELRPRVAGAATGLLLAACRAAVESGARIIRADDPRVLAVGFRPADGRFEARFDEIRDPTTAA